MCHPAPPHMPHKSLVLAISPLVALIVKGTIPVYLSHQGPAVRPSIAYTNKACSGMQETCAELRRQVKAAQADAAAARERGQAAQTARRGSAAEDQAKLQV